MKRAIWPGLAAVVLLAGLGTAVPASAQSVVMTVNGESITSYEIDQRMRLGRLERRNLTRQQATELLIEDKVKITEARRQGMRLNESFVEDSFARFAGNARQTPAQFEQILKQNGIDPETLKARIRADTLWSELSRQRSRMGGLVTTQEIEAELAERVRRGDTKVVEYTLLPVVFVVTRDAGGVAARERDARAAQSRFTSCEEGAAMLRSLRDVAVRDEVVRSTEGMGEPLRKLLERTPVGRATAPFRTEQGIEMLAVCGKTERSDTLNVRRVVEQELTEKRAQERSAGFLKELRARAVIERR
jgi:peptidyl-prolyl cis-trans isomerase SurA